jgi:D-glycero-D-manno-heptose 1,7-bisphosphate phosphatase
MTRRRFVLLDRDGTLIIERHYLSDPQQVELIPGVAAGLRQLKNCQLGLVVITNQSGVGRGLFGQDTLDLIHRRLCELLEAQGVHLDGIYLCPHLPEDKCPCRKPQPGLIELAAKELEFDPREAFVVGDKPCDIEVGRQVGATTFLVRTGYGNQVAAQALVTPDYIVDDLNEAANVIERLLAADERGLSNAVRP